MRKRAGGDRSSAGDPVRTLELLWRRPGQGGSTRGPKQRTTVDAVIAAAIRLADENGLEALTMALQKFAQPIVVRQGAIVHDAGIFAARERM